MTYPPHIRWIGSKMSFSRQCPERFQLSDPVHNTANGSSSPWRHESASAIRSKLRAYKWHSRPLRHSGRLFALLLWLRAALLAFMPQLRINHTTANREHAPGPSPLPSWLAGEIARRPYPRSWSGGCEHARRPGQTSFGPRFSTGKN